MEKLIELTKQLWPSMDREFEDVLRNSLVREAIPKKQLTSFKGC